VNAARVEKLMLQNQRVTSQDLSAQYTKLLKKNWDTARCVRALDTSMSDKTAKQKLKNGKRTYTGCSFKSPSV
jgi:hypothetical protein